MFCAHCSKMSSNCSSKSFIYISKTFWSQISAFWIQLKSVCIAWVIKLICRNMEISDSNANKNYMLTHWRINWYGWCGNQSSSKKMQIMLVCCVVGIMETLLWLCMYFVSRHKVQILVWDHCECVDRWPKFRWQKSVSLWKYNNKFYHSYSFVIFEWLQMMQ